VEVHVCSLARLAATVEATGARHVVTLINQNTDVPRPASVEAANHLFLGMNDIVAPMEGYVAPGAAHVEQLLGFVDGWWRSHGSESPIAAFITACMVNPGDDEAAIANELRRLSPSATPNIRLVGLADEMLRRNGRMVAAIEAIGRGRDAYEGDPFSLRLLR
jgi:predicted protein tyrosine phosphatase